MQKYLNHWGFGVVAALYEVAHAHGSTPARLALAWLGQRLSQDKGESSN